MNACLSRCYHLQGYECPITVLPALFFPSRATGLRDTLSGTSVLLENPQNSYVLRHIRDSCGVCSLYLLLNILTTSMVSCLTLHLTLHLLVCDKNHLRIFLESLRQCSFIFGNFWKCSETFVWPSANF